MVYSFDSANAPGRRRTQYFEMFINRGIYHDGWWAASRVNIPWEGSAAAANPDTAKWELYNLDEDFSQANDLADSNPAKLRELQDLWWTEAARYSVLPLDGRKTERLNAELQGRPSQTGKRTSVHLLSGRAGLAGRQRAERAQQVVLDHGRRGDQARARSRARSSRSAAATAAMASTCATIGPCSRATSSVARSRASTSNAPLPSGPVKLRGEFHYDGGGMGKGGTMSLFVNGQKVGEDRIEQTQAITLGLGGTLDVGEDTGSPVDDAYTPPFRFNGVIRQVTVDLQPK